MSDTTTHQSGPNDEALSTAVWEAVQESLGDAYDCMRFWAAWQCGTMSQDDFVRVADQPDRIDEIALAVLGVLPAAATKVHTWADMETISDEPKVDEALRAFSEDPTADHGVFVVEAILGAMGLMTGIGQPAKPQGSTACAPLYEPGQAPRVAPADVAMEIMAESYTVLPSGRVTVCELTLRNGFTVTGESAVAFIENNVPELGRKYAREKAVDRVFELLAFSLREQQSAVQAKEGGAA